MITENNGDIIYMDKNSLNLFEVKSKQSKVKNFFNFIIEES